MTLITDLTAFTDAQRAYEEHMLLAIGVEDVAEYLKIKEAALAKAAKVIEQYREKLEEGYRYQS